jgi:hypothetical protein
MEKQTSKAPHDPLRRLCSDAIVDVARMNAKLLQRYRAQLATLESSAPGTAEMKALLVEARQVYVRGTEVVHEFMQMAVRMIKGEVVNPPLKQNQCPTHTLGDMLGLFSKPNTSNDDEGEE